MIPGAANPLLLASAAGAAGYQIERSIRLNAPDSAYLSRTPSVAGNRKTWTWAGWAKRSAIDNNANVIFGARSSSYSLVTIINSNIYFYGLGVTGFLRTTALLRDPSAWYHIVAVYDADNATSNDRLQLYLNNSRITQFQASATLPLGTLSDINAAVEHRIGSDPVNASYLSGYLADVHFIDGQALDPTSFGEFDANGVWQPKAYTGSYPGNSFHLDFADNSAATTAGIGKDVSGNGNDWTPVNLSVAAGAGNDSLVDTPTNYGTDDGLGGSVRGNYATWNPLIPTTYTLANGNLDASFASGTGNLLTGTTGVTTGKWYWEILVNSGTVGMIGIADLGLDLSAQRFNGTGGLYYYQSTGGLYGGLGRTTVVSNLGYGATFTTGDIIGVALDMDSSPTTLTFYKNNVSQGVATNATMTGKAIAPAYTNGGGATNVTANFGQRPFAYPAPSGFKALCATNLPDPQTVTTSGSYTGNGVADGPFVYLNGAPTAMTINGNAVAFGTHADKLSNGFKVRTTSTTYNQNAAVYNYSITSTGDPFKVARAQSNP